jgi:polyisoprenoid-binding protein YceI
MVAVESTLTQTGTYDIDPVHSRIGFAVRHAMVATVRGSFNDFEGGGYFDIERPESSAATVTIDAGTVDTRHPDRDAHLRSEDFLDVASHPAITFSAVSIDQVGPSTYRVSGDLTIKGVTKPVVLEVERTGWLVESDGSQRIGFEGSGVLNRKDWGIGWNKLLDAGGVLISEHVTVEFEISAVKAPAGSTVPAS